MCERANTRVSACECAYTGDSTIRAKPCSPDAFSLFYYEHFLYIYYTPTSPLFIISETPHLAFFFNFSFLFFPHSRLTTCIYMSKYNTKCVHMQYSAAHDGVQISSTSEKACEFFPTNGLR